MFISCFVICFNHTSVAQYYSDTTLVNIDTNKLAYEGDMYLDTVNRIYKIGLTNGRLGNLNDNQNIDSISLKNDSLEVFITNGNSAQIDLSSLKKSAIVGDVKQGLQPADHEGWYLLDGRAISTLPVAAQTAAASLGLTGNLPDAEDRVMKHPSGSEILASTGGQATTTLVRANVPNYNLPTSTTTTNGSHSHTGTTSTDGDHSHTGSTNITGNHNHSITGEIETQSISSFFGSNRSVFAPSGTTNTSTSGNHSHALAINNNGNHSHMLTINNNGGHSHTVTVSSGGSGTSFDRYQPYMVVNHFIYLGQ